MFILGIHLFIVDYIIVTPSCTPFISIKRIDCKDFRINLDKFATQITYYPGFEKKIQWLKIQDLITYYTC